MGRTIAILNQKGGSGKTTTTVNLGACLAVLGHVVLLIDLDPQANATIHLGLKPHDVQHSLYNVMMEDMALRDIIRPTEVDNMFVAPANINLSGAEIELASVVGREMVLKAAVERMTNSGEYAIEFDFILIDCPPSLGLLTVNALTAVKEVIIPVQT